MHHLKRIMRLYLPVAFSLIFLAVIVINVIAPEVNYNLIPAIEKKATHSDSAYLASLPLLNEYESVTVKGHPLIQFKKNSIIYFISPKSELLVDSLYALAGLCVCWLFIFNLWYFENSKPFNKRLVSFVNSLEVILVVVWLLNIGRHYFIRNHLLDVTNNEYTIDIFIFSMPEFWLLVLINALGNIIKVGFKLQQDQDLTV